MEIFIPYILFILCTIFNLFGYVPQIIKLLKTRSTEGISISSWFIWVFSETCYLLYVLTETSQFSMISFALLNLGLIVLTTAMIIYYRYYRQRKKRKIHHK